jgi:5'-3' exonuclease
MRKVENALIYLAYNELRARNGKGLRFLISGADVPGEGEVKLLDWLIGARLSLRPRRRPRGDGSLSPRDRQPAHRPSVILVGGDGDLVLQALVLRGWDPYVLREVPWPGGPGSLISVS